MPETTPKKNQDLREGLTLPKILRFFYLPFCPRMIAPFLVVRRFEDIPVDRLVDEGFKGVLLDADGTLCTHHAREFPQGILTHVRRMVDQGLRVAIYTNSSNNRFQQFQGIEVVREAHAKPDRRGFEAAMKNHLRLDDPAKVCMVGDNFITDGGAVAAGMRFIYVQPIKGSEGLVHSLTRYWGYLCARFYFADKFKGLCAREKSASDS